MSDDEHTVKLRRIEGEIFVVVDGLTVAKRGKSGSLHAGIWMAIEPGWTIIELEGGNRLQVAYNGARIH